MWNDYGFTCFDGAHLGLVVLVVCVLPLFAGFCCIVAAVFFNSCVLVAHFMFAVLTSSCNTGIPWQRILKLKHMAVLTWPCSSLKHALS